MIVFNNIVKKKHHYSIIVNSLIFSIFLNVKIFAVIFGVENIIPIVLSTTLILAFVVNGISIISSNRVKLLVMFYLFFLLTLLWIVSSNNIADLYYKSAILFVFPSMIISNVKISFYWLTLLSLLLGILLYGNIDILSWMFEGDAGEKMYNSYLILPFIIFSFIGLYLYGKKLIILLLSLINIIIYTPILLAIGVRGLFVSIFLFFFLLILNSTFFEKNKNTIISFIFIFIFLFFSIDWLELMERLSDLLASYDIEFYVIEKYIMMFSNDDVSNGRNELYHNAFMGFLNSPIWGNGLGFFEKKNEGLYVHNIFLEILYEGGLVLSIVFVYVFTRFIRLLKKCSTIEKEYYIFIVLMFVLGCTILFFSNTLWRVVSFWLFFGVMFNKFKFKENERFS